MSHDYDRAVLSARATVGHLRKLLDEAQGSGDSLRAILSLRSELRAAEATLMLAEDLREEHHS